MVERQNLNPNFATMIYASRLAEAKLRGIGWAGFGALVMPVSQEDDRETKSKSYMWLYQSGSQDNQRPVVLYDYQATPK
jgi:hypothetical protein